MKGSNNLLKRAIAWLTPLRGLAIGLFSTAILVSLIGYLVDRGIWQVADWLQELILGYYANISVEFGSIVLTILVIDSLNEKRATTREIHRTILQLTSPNKEYSNEGLRILQMEGWLFDGTLNNAILRNIDLEGANLQGASCRRAQFSNANLSLANLRKANLTAANLTANLSMADLREANLEGANIEGANLSHANFWKAKATTCYDLEKAATLAGAILPDGTFLPNDDSWKNTFSDWCARIHTDARGYIVIE